MPDYDIYILPESEITISGGGQLDGVNQGSGVHLVTDPPTTITLESNSWQAINVTDNNTDFSDSQGSNQTSTNEHIIDGTTFAAGTNVEAEYALELTDGTNTYTVIAFNFSTGSPAYGTVEALAFIGPVGGFPPIGVPLTVVSNQEGPGNPAVNHASPPCFAKGTLIRTARGQRSVEDIAVSDLIETLDGKTEAVKWIGHVTYPAQGQFAPIRFAAGVLGNARPLWVSPQHRIWFAGWQSDLLFGEKAVLIPAHSFVDGGRVTREEGGFVTYYHLMFDAHQIIYSEGVASESFFAGEAALSTLDKETCKELRTLFPALFDDGAALAETALVPLKSYEAKVLLALPS